MVFYDLPPFEPVDPNYIKVYNQLDIVCNRIVPRFQAQLCTHCQFLVCPKEFRVRVGKWSLHIII